MVGGWVVTESRVKRPIFSYVIDYCKLVIELTIMQSNYFVHDNGKTPSHCLNIVIYILFPSISCIFGCYGVESDY